MRRNIASFSAIGSDEQDLLEKISKDLEENELHAKERMGNFLDAPSSESSLKTVESVASGKLIDKRLLKVQKAELSLGSEVVGSHALNVEHRRVNAENNPISKGGIE